MNSLNDIWQEIIRILSSQLTPTAITTWFSDCEPVEIDDCRLVLHTTTDFKRSIINSRFGDTIKAALSDLFSCDFDLLILAGDEINEYVNKKKDDNSLPEMAGYTFDRFIVGNSNKFAHAAAIAVAENPGKAYNPLFIYGNSGLGKTHLLLSIGQAIHDRDPSKKIAYVKGDEFTIGDGKGKPTGIFNATGGAETGVTSTGTSITFDDVMDLYYSLRAPYRNKAVWLLNDSTVKAIRKLKDGNGNYIWQPSVREGEPDRILNRPYRTSIYVPELAAGKRVMAFGDYSYYWIAERQGRSFKRLNELYATTGQVGFLASERVDGKLILSEAVKTLDVKAAGK